MATPIGGAFMEELKNKMLIISVLIKAGLVWLGLFCARIYVFCAVESVVQEFCRRQVDRAFLAFLDGNWV